MGAFHEGHLELIRLAKAECESCFVSLFVNPAQFGPKEDFKKYPRNEKHDFELASAAGADVIFAPNTEELYNSSTFRTRVNVSKLSDQWEGTVRPGHFEGVATIVTKLFSIVQPNFAYFGLKDLQQCAIVRKLVDDLNLDVCLRFIETVREPSGLAMSSRNRNLSDAELTIAPRFYKSLIQASNRVTNRSAPIPQSISGCKAELEEAGFIVEYVAVVDPESMDSVIEPTPGSRMIAAVRIGEVRLIDNVAVDGS